jgi:Ca2+-binding RTX toxin-like protein
MAAITPFAALDPTLLTSSLVAANSGIVVDPTSVVLKASGAGAVNLYDGSIAALGIGAGLLLTSGTTPTTVNTSTSFGSDNSFSSGFFNGDADINAVVNTVFNTQSYDATTLSFRFSVSDPTATSISFDIVFGSDEFPEWADMFVDAAVVIVNGVNYALFNHDPAHPLSVISPNVTAGYFQNNNGTNLLPVEYDGVSRVLRIVAPIFGGGAVNTIKIGIADTGDHVLDSGLFISNMVAGTTPGSGLVANPGGGTIFNDTVTGTAKDEFFDLLSGDDLAYAGGGADIVVAGAGNDTLYGGSGNDELKGDGGNDLLDGGTEDDTAVYSGAKASYLLSADAASGGWRLDGSATGEGLDTLVSVEHVRFSDGLYFLTAAGLSLAAPPPPPPADQPGMVIVSGIGKVGDILTATVSDPNGLATPISYQWQRSLDQGLTWTAISLATAATYTVQAGDKGGLVKVQAQYTDLAGFVSSLLSAPRSILNTFTGNFKVSLINMAAPKGSVLATPLTTLVQRAIDLGYSATVAAQLIKGALGIAPSVNLGSYDARAVLQANPLDPVARRVEAAAVQAAILTSYSDDDSGIQLTEGILNALAVDPNVVLDLGNDLTITTILSINDINPKGSVNYKELLRRNSNITTDLLAGRDVLVSVDREWKGVLGAEDPNAALGIAALLQTINLAPTGWSTGTMPAVLQGGTALIKAADLLAGFSDPNVGDTLSVLNLVADSGSVGANLTAAGLPDGTWTYTPAPGFAGPVEFTYQVADGQGASITAHQLLVVTAVVAPQAPTDHAATGTLAVAGTAAEGSSLTASLSGLVDPDGPITATSFRWQRDQAGVWGDILGATAATLAIPSDQSWVGWNVRVQATSSDALGGVTPFTGAPLTIANVNDLPTGVLTLVGVAQQGKPLSFTSTLADADGIAATGAGAVTYQWQRLATPASAPVLVGSGPTYTPTAADVGALVQLKASYVDAFGTAESLLSAPTAAVLAPAGLVLTGTAGADVLNGGALDDKLSGLAGNDVLNGGAGKDTLDGGLGIDQLNGGDGDDVYLVENTKDTVSETNTNPLTGGIDRVESSITWTLAANVENLTLTGVVAIDGTGNTLANSLVGNDANNLLTGNAGNDSIAGGGGADALIGGAGADWLSGGTGADVFRFTLTDSLLASMDRVTDFAIGSDSFDLTDPYAITSALLRKLAAVSALSEAAIGAVLTPISFDRKGAATFTYLDPTAGLRSFLAVNDGKAGFQALSDSVIEITGYTGNLNLLAVV